MARQPLGSSQGMGVPPSRTSPEHANEGSIEPLRVSRQSTTPPMMVASAVLSPAVSLATQ